MLWIKRGLIYVPDGTRPWSRTHAQVPLADMIGDGRLRIYFGTRDERNRTSTSFLEADASNPARVLYVHDQPVLGPGRTGMFDDSGAMPSWLVDVAGRKYLYYIGFNTGGSVPFRNAIGLAVSDDGVRFERVSEGPVLDRSMRDPLFVSTPCTLIENDRWRMWYLSGTKWERFGESLEPFYNIRCAESDDGVDWRSTGRVAIDVTANQAAIARPCVLRGDRLHRMWYSFRGGRSYRTDTRESYRVGYAESSDGQEWVRRDDEVGIGLSASGWDSEMIAYPFVFESGPDLTMLYNGNGFGKSGFGYAVLDRSES